MKLTQSVEETKELAVIAARDASMALANTETNKKQITDNREELTKKIKQLEDILDDQVNRNMRSTLVFKGISLHESERSWDDTSKVLSDKISNMSSGNGHYRVD